MQRIKIASFFTGGGFLDMGFEQAGFDVAFTNEFNDHISDMHDHAYTAWRRSLDPHAPEAKISFRGSIEDVNVDDIGDVDGIIGGPPCFVAGTMILTMDGYKPIEQIQKGTLVLTHLGRWRRVTGLMSRKNIPLRHIRAQGTTTITTTNEHPFWAKEMTPKWNNLLRRNVRAFSDPEFVKASALTVKKHYLSQLLPPLVEDDHDVNFWWLVGRYLADGWLVNKPRKERKKKRYTNQKAVAVCCGKYEADDLALGIRRAGFNYYRREERTTYKFFISGSEFHDFLIQFGKYAHGKLIPGWILGLSQDKAKALLEGYLSGDGNKAFANDGKTPYCRAWSSSKALALGVALLAQRAFGVVASICLDKREGTHEIEGRIVKRSKGYTLSIPEHNRSAFVQGNYGWKLLKKNEPLGKNGTVYNLHIEEDESYVAEGAVVHNCPAFSVAGKQGGEDDPRGKLSKCYIDLIIKKQPKFFVMENVPGLARTAKHKKYLRQLRLNLKDAGYVTDVKILNALEYGAPQDRERMFMVGFASEFLKALPISQGFEPLCDGWFPYPEPLYPGAKEVYPWPDISPFGSTPPRPDVPEQLTINSCLVNLDGVANSMEWFNPYSKQFALVAEGDVHRKSYKRPHRHRYSPTAAYGNNEVHFHPWFPRRMSVRECLRVQSLPDDYVLPAGKSLSIKFKCIGNGVSVVLARALAMSVMKFIQGQG